MKNGFLEALSKRLIESKIPLGNQTVILPTQRAIHHFRALISNEIKVGDLLPTFFTLNEWLAEMADLIPASQLEQRIYGYRSYQKHLGSDARSFSDFISWSSALLSDFNDIDNHLIDAQSLFRNLNEYTEIENFSFLSDPLSEKQVRVQAFWSALPKIYEDYKSGLIAQGIAYPGLIARTALKRIEKSDFGKDTGFIIGGFNALSASEKACFQALKRKLPSEVFFDADPYYLKSKNNQAGAFIRQFISEGAGEVLEPELSLSEKAIEVGLFSAKHDVDQTEMASDILSKLSLAEQDETAVVLAEEGLLLPLLRRIPENISHPNITMGLKASDSVFATWLDEVFSISSNAKGELGNRSIHSSHWESFETHPFTASLGILASKQKGYRSIEKLGVEAEDPEGILKLLVAIWHSSGLSTEALLGLSQSLAETEVVKSSKSVEMRLNFKGILAVLKRLKELKTYPEGQSLDTPSLQNLCRSYLSATTLALKGDANKGVQIMGLLETRALNYKNIILFSVNEGSLPKAGQTDSFIPFEIRNFHKLPGIRERESVYAYYFYRLIQNAEKVSLIYTLSQEGFNAKEPSRYISQLKYELREQNPQAKIIEYDAKPASKMDIHERAPVLKTPETMALIKKQIETRLSASGINLYLNDSLEWYYNYVLQIREPKSTEITAATFGDVVHEVLDLAYKPFEGQVLLEEHFKIIAQSTEKLLQESLSKLIGATAFKTGSDRLQFEVARRTIKAFIQSDKASLKKHGGVHYLRGEELLKRELEVDTQEGTVKVNFFGYADRIERRNGLLTVLDYKTGTVYNTDLKFDDFTPESFASKGKAFQLMLYKWMALSSYPDKEVAARIISLPKPNIVDLVPACANADVDDMDAFEGVLKSIVKSMLDQDVALSHNAEYAYGIFE